MECMAIHDNWKSGDSQNQQSNRERIFLKKAVVAFYSVNEAEEHFGYPQLSRPGRSGNANGHSLRKDTNSDESRVRVYSESPFSRELLAY